MNNPRWQGIFPAITTKFHADESIDAEGTARYIEGTNALGVAGGSTEHMRRPRPPLIGAEREFIETVVKKALATRPVQYQSVP